MKLIKNKLNYGIEIMMFNSILIHSRDNNLKNKLYLGNYYIKWVYRQNKLIFMN